MACVEVVVYWVIVRRCSYHNKIRLTVGLFGIKCGGKFKRFLSKVLLNKIVLDWRDVVVDFFNLFRDYINCYYLVVLGQQSCYT